MKEYKNNSMTNLDHTHKEWRVSVDSKNKTIEFTNPNISDEIIISIPKYITGIDIKGKKITIAFAGGSYYVIKLTPRFVTVVHFNGMNYFISEVVNYKIEHEPEHELEYSY